MNIEEAKKNIGKEVVLNEDTKPYLDSYGSDIYCNIIKSMENAPKLIINTIDASNVGVSLIDKDGEEYDYWYVLPAHLKLKQPNYKIRVTEETSAEAQSLLFELGCGWSDNSNLPKYINFSFLYTENGLIKATNDYGIFLDNPAKGVTIPELRQLVLDSKSEYEFEKEIESHDEQMTWKELLQAEIDRKVIEALNKRFHIKPPSITLEARAYTKEELIKIVEGMK